MKITGVIAEYNPFHNGHKYHIEQARMLSGADYVIAIISGDFTQRGTPAVIDKYTRTRMALLNGADLVLELPAVYAVGSAEFFSMGAVTLLDKLGAVDFLCFGSECGNLKTLSRLSAILLEEPEEYRAALRLEQKKGLSFPKARSLALQHCCPFDADITSSPNNILGMEYIKALLKRNSPIVPLTIQRRGNGYHDVSLKASDQPESPLLSSATAIRGSITSDGNFAEIKNHVPDSVFRLLEKAYGKGFPVTSNDFSPLLHYKLLSETGGFERYQDVTPALSDKIKKQIYSYKDFEQFCALLKSKDMTYSRISRCLTHILLQMTTSGLEEYRRHDFVFYARILGFKRESAGLLGVLKANASIPLLSKLADAASLLSAPGIAMLEEDIRISHIYRSTVCSKFRIPFVNEYVQPIVIL